MLHFCATDVLSVTVLYSATVVAQRNGRLKEPKIWIQFWFNFGKPASMTYDMLKIAFHDDAMGSTQTFQQCSGFKSGQTSVENSKS
jgi:hypothetical protein